MRPASKAWAALGIGVAAYDVLSPKGETLSEGIDSALESRYRALVIGSVALTACHLLNVLPEKIDPFHHALKWKH